MDTIILPQRKAPPGTLSGSRLKVSSHAFQSMGKIPLIFTADGLNYLPSLDIDHIPRRSRSAVIMVYDEDAPKGSWVHWLTWNVPIKKHFLFNGLKGIQGTNDFGLTCYCGPCHLYGTHRYIFKIFTLDNVLYLREGAGEKELSAAMEGHITGTGQLAGLYTFTPNFRPS